MISIKTDEKLIFNEKANKKHRMYLIDKLYIIFEK